MSHRYFCGVRAMTGLQYVLRFEQPVSFADNPGGYLTAFKISGCAK